MSDDLETRRRRAEEIRRQIAGLQSEPEPGDHDEEIQPGESPKEYVERREREIRERSKQS